MKYTYAVALTPDETDGGFIVSWRDLPEAITQGDTLERALAKAADALDEAISGRIKRGAPSLSRAPDKPGDIWSPCPSPRRLRRPLSCVFNNRAEP